MPMFLPLVSIRDLLFQLRRTSNDRFELGKHGLIGGSVRVAQVHLSQSGVRVFDGFERCLTTFFILLCGLDAFANRDQFLSYFVTAIRIIESLDQWLE